MFPAIVFSAIVFSCRRVRDRGSSQASPAGLAGLRDHRRGPQRHAVKLPGIPYEPLPSCSVLSILSNSQAIAVTFRDKEEISESPFGLMLEPHWETLDVDGDGEITPAEWFEFFKVRRRLT